MGWKELTSFLNLGKKKVNKFEEPVKSKKEIEAEKQAELALIFKPVVDSKQNATGLCSISLNLS